MPRLTDWVVELQYDDSKVNRGLKQLDKKFRNFAKNQSRFNDKLLSNEMKTMDSLYVRKSRKESELTKQKIDNIKRVGDAETNLQRRRQRTATGQAPYTRLNPLSFEGRLSQESQIGRTMALASGAAAALTGNEDAKSIQLKKQLESEIRVLISLQKQLTNVTYRNTEAYRALRQNLVNTKQRVAGLRKEVSQVNREFRAGMFAANGFKSSIQNMARSYISVFAALGAVAGIVRVGRQLEDTSAVMLLASGNAKQAAEDMRFVEHLSKRVKINVADLSRSFATFATAGRSAGVSSKQVLRNFEDLSVAVRATGLSQDRANLAFLAFRQMLSGPVIQAQEINQAVDQMPQFLGAAQKALKEMGMEGKSFKETIQSGTVDSQKFVEIVTRIMREQAISSGAFEKSVDSITGMIGDATNELYSLVKDVMGAGLSDSIKNILKNISTGIRAIKPFAVALARILGLVFDVLSPILNIIMETIRPVGEFIDLIFRTRDAWTGINQELDRTSDKLTIIQRIMLVIRGVAKVIIGLFQLISQSLASMPDLSFESIKGGLKSYYGSIFEGLGFSNPFKSGNTSSNSTVNSNNTTSVQITVPEGSSLDEIQRVVDKSMQNHYANSMPNN